MYVINADTVARPEDGYAYPIQPVAYIHQINGSLAFNAGDSGGPAWEFTDDTRTTVLALGQILVGQIGHQLAPDKCAPYLAPGGWENRCYDFGFFSLTPKAMADYGFAIKKQ